MGKFKLEFEIRRIVFGLSSILRTPVEALPQLIREKLPDITKQLGILSSKVSKERFTILEANEKYVDAGGKESDDDEEIGSDDEEGSDIDEDEMENQTYEKLKKSIKKFNNGQPNPNDEFDSDDDDDSDYEDNAGEYALYDSPIEKTDELLFLKETLETIHNLDQSAFQFLVST